jgi:hypothetical protein
MVKIGKAEVGSQKLAARMRALLLFLLASSFLLLTSLSLFAQSIPWRFANLENIRFASEFAGADWAAKINAANTEIGAGTGTIIVPSSLAGTASTALSLSAGRQVIFDAGTFVSSVAQPISNVNIRISGAGPGVTIFTFTGATNGFSITPSISTALINLSGFSVLTSNASAGKAISLAPSVMASDINLRNIYIDQTGSGRWSYGLWASQYQSSELSGLSMRNVTVGIHLENGSNADTIINPIIAGTYATGIELNGANDCWLVGGTIQGSPTTALIDLQSNSGLSTAGTHLESAASTRTYGVKAGGYYASFVGVQMTSSGYTSAFYHTGGEFSLSNSYITASASVALVNVVGNGGGSGTPATLMGNHLQNTHASGVGVMVDGTMATKISGGTVQANSDCLLLGSVYAAVSVLVDGAFLNPIGGSGYAVNSVSLADVGSLTLIGNRFGVSVGSGRIISGGNYRALGNTAMASHWPDTIMTDAGDPLVLQTAHNYAGTLQEWRKYGGAVGASVDYNGNITAGSVTAGGPVYPKSYTFTGLPSCSTTPMVVFCSDCNSTCTAGSSTGRTCFCENSAWTH